MGLRGSHVVSIDGKVTLISSICSDPQIIRHSKWKNSTDAVMDERTGTTLSLDARVKVCVFVNFSYLIKYIGKEIRKLLT